MQGHLVEGIQVVEVEDTQAVEDPKVVDLLVEEDPLVVEDLQVQDLQVQDLQVQDLQVQGPLVVSLVESPMDLSLRFCCIHILILLPTTIGDRREMQQLVL